MKDGHYLPFKEEYSSMPDNCWTAEQHVQNLKRKFIENDTFHDEYTSFLTEMIDSSYAEVVPEDQMNRTEGENSLVNSTSRCVSFKEGNFDCGAVFKGTSLNCQVLQGPDITNSLTVSSSGSGKNQSL